MRDGTPPWEWPFKEWYALPTGPIQEERSIDPETGVTTVRPVLAPISVRFISKDEPVAMPDKRGGLWRFGQFADGSWYKEPVHFPQ